MERVIFFLFMAGVVIGIAGICVSEIILVYALISRNPKVSTRTCGRWIMAFLAILTVSVTALLFVNR